MADVCESYGYALAIQDAVPVVAAAIGYAFLHRRVKEAVPQAALPVAIAAVLLVVGSFNAGVLRKLLIAGSETQECFLFLQRPFFSVLAPAFAILMWGAWCVMADRKISFWPFFVLLALGVIGAVAADDNLPLLAAGGLWAVGLAVIGAIISKRQGDAISVVLYSVYAIGVLSLPGLGNRENVSDVANQWTAQGVNTVSQICFAVACYRLWMIHQRRTALTTVEN
jgi:hypothetical protein